MESSNVTLTTKTTTVVTEQPAVGESRTVIIRGPTALHDWSTGLCDCIKDLNSCLLSFLCFRCYSCYIATRQNESCCVPVCVPGAEVAMRTKIRTQENIHGSICDDCIKLCFCPCCSLAQMARELDHVDHKL